MWCDTKKGKAQYRERFVDPMTEKPFVVSVTFPKDTASNRKLAQAILLQKRDAKIGSSFASKENLTFEKLIDLYRIDQKKRVKPATYDRNYYACKSLMVILGKGIRVNNLSAGYVKERFNSTGDSNGTLNERTKRLKALIRWGYANDYIDDIKWLDKLTLLPDPEKKRKIQEKYYEKDELKKLLEGMDVKIWRMLTQFCALSGLRIGEAIALKKSNVDFKNKLIHVVENYNYIRKEEGSTKTDSSTRDVYMQPQLESLCKEIKAYSMKLSGDTGCYSVYFFHDFKGDPVNYFTFNKYLKENSIRILGKKASTHILRHTHTSLLAASGVELAVISRRLGHSDSSVTRDVYFHITEQLKERDNQIIAQINIL